MLQDENLLKIAQAQAGVICEFFGVPHPVVLTFAQALDILKEKAGIDAGYWLGKSSIDPYFDELIIKIATAFVSQGTVP